MMKLYSYFRSSASYRVRIALALKELPYDYAAIHLLNDGGKHRTPEYQTLNPEGLVPALVDGTSTLTQSLAIIEYLEEIHPQPPLLPPASAPIERARVRALALSIACDIHPLNNLRVLRYLVRELKVDEDGKNAWYRHWAERGLAAVERQLAASSHTGRFCHGDTPTLADCCLVPQVFNAQRFGCDLSALPTVMRVNEACLALPAFQSAAPDVQPDAE